MKSFRSFVRSLMEDRISGRFPTAKKGADDPMSHDLVPDLATMRRNPESFNHNMGVLANSNHYKDVDRSKLEGASPDEVAEHYIHHFTQNILAIHDAMDPHIRQKTAGWYDGAHALTKRRAEQYKLPHSSVAGVYAALSPQKNWHQNVSLGDRVLDVYHNKQDHPWSPEMEQTAKRIWKPKDQEIIGQIRGKKLSELSDPIHKAAWIRTHDEAHNPRSYAIISPTGDETSHRGNNTTWQLLSAITKAVSCIESKGDLPTISKLMGEKHKVRSFYNNIIDPNSHLGDVTVDTHAVAAAHLKPYGGSAMPVNHAMGTSPEAGKKPANWTPVKSGGNATGIEGTYPLYAEAYRRAAQARGILPRQMQSIAWEGVRAMYPQKAKQHKGFKASVDSIWEGHHNGEYDANEARRRIFQSTGGLKGKRYEWQEH